VSAVPATVQVVVRPAAPRDDGWLRRLFAELHGINASLDSRFALAEGWEQVFASHLEHERQQRHGMTWLAEAGPDPAGFLMIDGHVDSPLFRHRHWAEVLALYVVPEWRGRGVARALLAAGAEWAGEHGHDRLQLHVTASNSPARAFYAAAGFVPVQEIWRLDLPTAGVAPPGDPQCEAIYAHGHALLGGHVHGGESCDRPGEDRARTNGNGRSTDYSMSSEEGQGR
jgi:GNAT superfamily N-acetyltransferase